MAREESTDFTVVRVNRWSTLYYQGEFIETVEIEEEDRLLTEWLEDPFVRWNSGSVHDVYTLRPDINTDMKNLMFKAVHG